MKEMTRRRLIATGLMAGTGATGLSAAARIARRYGLIPPDSGGIYGPGTTLTYASQRLLTRHSLAREFLPDQISKAPFANGRPPKDKDFLRMKAAGFTDWRLLVEGMVARPLSLSLSELQSYPSSTQITHLACEEGWSYIAQWTGVPLGYVLDRAGASPKATHVVYHSAEPGWWESIDMADALHPQTLVTYSMNGGELPVPFGGPLRMRVPRQLGYKSLKYINRLTITDNVRQFGNGLGSSEPDEGYSWYAGI